PSSSNVVSGFISSGLTFLKFAKTRITRSATVSSAIGHSPEKWSKYLLKVHFNRKCGFKEYALIGVVVAIRIFVSVIIAYDMFKRSKDAQDEKCDQRRGECDRESSQAYRDPDRRRHPNSCRGRQAANVAFFCKFENASRS